MLDFVLEVPANLLILFYLFFLGALLGVAGGAAWLVVRLLRDRLNVILAVNTAVLEALLSTEARCPISGARALREKKEELAKEYELMAADVRGRKGFDAGQG